MYKITIDYDENGKYELSDMECLYFPKRIIELQRIQRANRIPCANFLAILAVQVAIKEGKIKYNSVQILTSNDEIIHFDKNGQMTNHSDQFEHYNDLKSKLI